MNKLKRITLLDFFLFLIPLPLFFMPNGTVFRGSSFDLNSFSIPISLIVLIIMYCTNSKYIMNIFREGTFFLMYIYVLIVFFLLVGIFYSEDFNALLLLVSVLPMFLSYGVGLEIAKKEQQTSNYLSHLFQRLVKFTALISLSHVISSINSYGFIQSFVVRGEDSFFDLFSIYQKFIYYPTILSCFFIFSLYIKSKYKFIFSFFIFFDIVMVGSRESILICVFGMFSILMYNHIIKRTKRNFAVFLFIIIFFSVSFLTITNSSALEENITFINKINELNESGDYSGGRGDAIEDVFNKSEGEFNLIFGTSYSMSLGDIRTPHNQYLEIFLRSGLIGFVLFLILILRVYVKSFLILKKYKNHHNYNAYFSIIIVYFALTLLSFNINTPVRAPFSAILLGLLMGFIQNFQINEKKNSNNRKITTS